MNLVIDNIDSFNDWTASNGAVLYEENEIKNYVAGYNEKSLLFYFNGSGANVVKTFQSPIDVSQYNRLGFYLWSRSLKNKGLGLSKFDDFCYSLKINNGPAFLIPTPQDFEPIFFTIDLINEIEKLEFTALTDTEDYLIISYCVAYTDEYPLDIFQGVKTGLSNIIENQFESKYSLGNFTFNAGDKVLWLGNSVPWAEKYSGIKITDGVNIEYHQLGENDENGFLLTSQLEGDTIKHDYTNAEVTLHIPIDWGRFSDESFFPIITLWGMSPEPIIRGNKLEKIYDTYKDDGTVGYRQTYQIFDYSILIDAEAYERQLEILADLNKAIRTFIAQEYVWINGKKHFIKFQGAPSWVDPVSGDNQLPKIQWEMSVEVNEDIWAQRSAVGIIEDNLKVEALDNG